MRDIEALHHNITKGKQMKVYCYFNLHKKCFSVKSLEGSNKGKVIMHADRVLLGNVTFKVSEAGRQRVLLEKRKNVHAGVVGEMLPNDVCTDWAAGDTVTYNPYLGSSFFNITKQQPIKDAQLVFLSVNDQRSTIKVWK